MTGAEGLGYYRDPARRRKREHAAAAAAETDSAATAATAAAAAPPAPPIAATSAASNARASLADAVAEDDSDVVSPPVVLTEAEAALEASHIADLILQRGKRTAKPMPKPKLRAFAAGSKDAAPMQSTGVEGKEKRQTRQTSVDAAANVVGVNEEEKTTKKKKKKKKKTSAKKMPSGRATAEPLPDWMA